MKKITAILLVLLLALTCITMAACNKPFDTEGAQKALDLYIFEQEGQVVSGEFVLPGTIGGFATTWTSSNDIITLTEVPADEANGIERQYTVKVGYPEEVTDVVLTVALSDDVKKSYTVTVNPVSVHDFISAYTFLNDKGTVVADFALDQTCTFAGKTATIAWSVDSEYADYIEISADGKTCIVYPTSLNPTVRIKATFTYNGETATKTFRMTVSEQKDHLQEVDYWYSNTDVGMTMVGYVVEIATEYSSSYQNVSLYIVDEDFCAGYYLYRVKCDDETAAQLVPGAPVIVTGTMNTNYNGLMETNSGGTIEIDSDRTAVNVREHVHAIDNEIIGGLFSANYHQSSLVSLTNWTVKEVKDAPTAASSTETLFILTKGGVDVPVVVSKYHEGSYKRVAGDTVWEGLVNHGVQKGDVISITGLLGNYNGHQIALLSASDIVKGGTADAEGTVYPGKTAKTAVDAIDALLEENGLTAPIVAVEKAIELPTIAGVTIEATVLGGNSIEVKDGVIFITPGKLESSCVRFDVKVGDFATSIFRYIKTEDLDDAGKLATEKASFELELTEVVRNSEIELPATGTLFGDIAIAWSFKNGTAPAFATLDGATLTVTLPEEATTITLVATLSLGEATPVTKEFTISVAKAEAKILVTADVLGLGNYADGNGVVDGVGFAYVELGDYDFGIQMRNKSADGGKQSKIANTTALGTGIAKIVLTLHSGKSTYDNADAFAFRFGTSASDLTAQVIMLSTVKGQFEYTITPNAATYTFFSMEDALTYSFYIESIQIYYNGEIEVVECDHVYDNACDSKCNECGATRTVGDHVDAGTKDCLCDNCGAAIDHVDAGTKDCVCDNCGTELNHVDADKNGTCDNCQASIGVRELINKVTGADLSTIPAVLDLGASKDHNTYTTEKYLVIGYVDEVYNTQYGNMYIVDAEGNKLTIYGTYNNDGTKKYSEMTTKPVAGDVVVIYGVVGQYNGTAQIKNGWIMQINETVLGNVPAPECTEHTDANTDNKCDVCGKDLTPAATIPAPVDGTYKMFVVQAKLSKTLYFAGEINSDEHCTATDIADSAEIITITKTGDNAYTLKVGEKFLEIYINGAGKSRTRLVDTASGTWAWDSTIGIFTWTVDSTAYYLGTFDENAIIRASALSYITGDNASKLGVSQFVCQYEAATPSSHTHTYVWTDNGDGTCSAVCSEDATHTLAAREHADSDKNYVCDNCGATLEAPAPVVCPLVVGTGYTISAANANGTIYFVGTVTSGRFDGTLTATDAAVVYIENATNAGEYYLYMIVGTTKTYIVINDTSTGAAFTTSVAEASVFEWNADKETLAVAEDSNNRAFGASATSTYNNFSCYDLSGSYNWGQFTAVESSEPACEHEYDNVHDNECNLCGEPNPDYVADHVYTNECDEECDVCWATREDAPHIYSSECDQTCDCGATREPLVAHTFDNACDTTCNECDHEREITHTYDNACDADCNVCGETRVPSNHVDENPADNKCDVCGGEVVPPCAEHTYTDDCDAICDVCYFVRDDAPHYWANDCATVCSMCETATREPVADHVYTNECDEECDVCWATREDAPHNYSSECDQTCDCGATREPLVAHTFDNACDTTCNECDHEREITHTYDNACDADCNVCGDMRTPEDHVFDNNCDNACNVCGEPNPDLADHADWNYDGKCDECGVIMTAHEGTEADPYSVADALLVAGELAQGETSTDKLFTIGVIKSIGSTGSYLKNVYIVDTEDSSKEILIYTVNFTTEVASVAVGDTITVNGYIKNYNGTLEIVGVGSDYAYFTACTPHICDMSGATCTVPSTCSICGKTEGETIDHADGDYNCVCDECEKALAHVDENEDGECDVCGTEISSAAPVEASLGKVTFGATTNTNKTSGYTAALTTVANGITLTSQNFNSNNNDWNYIKCGRKSDASVATISTGAMTQSITKVVVTIDSVLDASKVNSFKLVVATDSNFTNVVETIDGTIGTGEKTFNITAPQAGLYYQIVFDCSSHGSKNGIVQVSGVEFFGYNA